MSNEMCFFQPKTLTTIDFVRPDGLSLYGSKTLEQLTEQYGEVVIIDTESAYRQHCDSYKKAPVEINEERFMDMLEILPPAKWVRHVEEESFHVCERIAGNIVSIFVRIGKRYFEMQDEIGLSHADRVRAAAITLSAETH
jgi:hypothetical protein